MLTHHNLVSNLVAAGACIEVDDDDVGLSFLPLSHSFERLASYLFLANGMTIIFAESMDTVARDLLIVKPTVMTAVPRVYEKLYTRVIEKGHASSGLRRKLFQWAARLAEDRGRRLPEAGLLPAQHARLLAAKIADTLGSRRSRRRRRRSAFLVSHAPLPAHIVSSSTGALTIWRATGSPSLARADRTPMLLLSRRRRPSPASTSGSRRTARSSCAARTSCRATTTSRPTQPTC